MIEMPVRFIGSIFGAEFIRVLPGVLN